MGSYEPGEEKASEVRTEPSSSFQGLSGDGGAGEVGANGARADGAGANGAGDDGGLPRRVGC